MGINYLDGPAGELQYTSTERYWEGVISVITDSTVIIEIKGRMGKLEVPRRMVISNYEMKVGQEVGFLMSYPEVLKEQPNPQYQNALETYHNRQEEAQQNHSEN